MNPRMKKWKEYMTNKYFQEIWNMFNGDQELFDKYMTDKVEAILKKNRAVDNTPLTKSLNELPL